MAHSLTAPPHQPAAKISGMSSPALITSEPEVVIGPDGLPRLSQAYLDAYERFMQTLVTEDDQPVDSFFSAVQARLLIDALYASWKHPRFGRRFIAIGNVGVFYAFHQPPIVPDMSLSLDVTPPADLTPAHPPRHPPRGRVAGARVLENY